MQRLERQLADKEEELESAAGRAQAKLAKVKERHEATVTKLNSVI